MVTEEPNMHSIHTCKTNQTKHLDFLILMKRIIVGSFTNYLKMLDKISVNIVSYELITRLLALTYGYITPSHSSLS